MIAMERVNSSWNSTVRMLGLPMILAVMLLALPFTELRSQELHPVPSLRDQSRIEQEWLGIRLTRILPELMRTHGVDMWVIPMREYNEDPVFSSLVSATTFAARRRTIYVFYDRGPEKGVERLALGGSSQGGLYEAYRDTTLKDAELWGASQWRLLRSLIEQRNPRSIAVNISATHAFSDGLTAGEWEQMRDAIGETYASRVVRRERLALDYITLRPVEMIPTYTEIMKASHAIIARAFSSEVITPGVTRTSDVVWWMRQTAHEAGFSTWFHPSVDVQRAGGEAVGEDPVIMRGDVLLCDFGLTTMRLNTDTQHMGYVLKEGEKEVPAGLVQALKHGMRLQDIVMDEMSAGGTGNEILRRSLSRMKSENIDGTVYSHPIGQHGHGAGPLIGLWDRQQGVPGRGDVEILPNSWYSIELQATTPIAEWNGQEVRIAMEEDALVSPSGKVSWVLGRQLNFHLVRY